MRVFLDTNILVDVLLNRPAFVVESEALILRCEALGAVRMSATLTVNLEPCGAPIGRAGARAHQTTLAEVVGQQLRVMASNWGESRAGRTPITDGLRGALKLPPDFDERAVLTEELQKKAWRPRIPLTGSGCCTLHRQEKR